MHSSDGFDRSRNPIEGDGFRYLIHAKRPYAKVQMQRLEGFLDLVPPIRALGRDPDLRPASALLIDCSLIYRFEPTDEALDVGQRALERAGAEGGFRRIALFAPVTPVYMALTGLCRHTAFRDRFPIEAFWNKREAKYWLAGGQLDRDTSHELYQDR